MRVVFVQKFVPAYRLPFFERVRDRLARDGIELVLLYGKADPFEGSKVRTREPAWGFATGARHVKLLGRWLYWQGVFRHVRRGDLVVVEHASKLLDNYVLFFARQLGYLKMGYFGHGENFQAGTEFALSRVLKRWTVGAVDRWFAYTEISRERLLRQGVADARIVVVNNTLVEPEGLAFAEREPEPRECLFIGGLYDLKLLPLLVAAGDRVIERLPDFVLHVVGTGPDRAWLEEQARTRPWLVVHGALYGEARDAVIGRSAAILMPGLVGLVAIDSFHFRRPIVTSDAGEHSPEIAYLEHERNCLVVDEPVTAERYAKSVVRLLEDRVLLERLRDGCRASSELYSIDAMADRFCDGARSALQAVNTAAERRGS